MTLRFRPLERRDVALVAGWLAAPHVAAGWRDHRPEAVEARYGPVVDGADPTEGTRPGPPVPGAPDPVA